MKIDLLGVKIDAIKKEELEEKLVSIFASKKKSLIFTPNAEFVMRAQIDEEFKQVLNSSSINIADGIGILWAAKYDSFKMPNIPVIKQLVAFLLWLISLFSIIFYF